MTYALYPYDRADVDKLAGQLGLLVEQPPQRRAERLHQMHLVLGMLPQHT